VLAPAPDLAGRRVQHLAQILRGRAGIVLPKGEEVGIPKIHLGRVRPCYYNRFRHVFVINSLWDRVDVACLLRIGRAVFQIGRMHF
jgi:hypothetical protein